MSPEDIPNEPGTWTWPGAYGAPLPAEGETPLLCPRCGLIYQPGEVPEHLRSVSGLVPEHFFPEPPRRCPGSGQNPLRKDGGEP